MLGRALLFTIWDALGGSLRLAVGEDKVRFGLAKADSNHNPHALGSALVGPFRASWRLLLARFRSDQPLMPSVKNNEDKCGISPRL